MQTLAVRVDDIELGERHRALSSDAVQRLAGSMGDIGLKQPISIRISDNVMIDGKACDGVPILVAGAHRLAAAKAMGWEKIDCIEVEDDPITAELWEIAENLHRVDLSKEQRDAHIRRYTELTAIRLQSSGNSTIESKRADGRGHRPQGIVAKVSQDLGVSKDIVRAANNPKPAPRRVIDVPDQLDHYDQIEVQVRALMTAWNKAAPEARDLFLERIDVPVMDRAA